MNLSKKSLYSNLKTGGVFACMMISKDTKKAFLIRNLWMRYT